MVNSPAILALADGTIFEGESVGIDGVGVGELVFNTAMTGYQEILTDPSYARQIVTLTTAHVGNTGCNLDDMESSKAWVSGLVIQNCSLISSNYRSQQTFPAWLKKQGIVAIAGIDTRQLTHRLRDQGTVGACISTHVDAVDEALQIARDFGGLTGLDLALDVSRQMIERWHGGQGEWAKASLPLHWHIVVYDFGVKQNILRILHDLGCYLTLVPANTAATEVLALNPDGVLFSNGPGDPAACEYAIAACQELLKFNIPILGICLGFQILALACGASSEKMKLGHHGANHPVIEVDGFATTAQRKRVFITSQNHGFAIAESSLPDCLMITHRSLFDHSLQGFMHRTKPALGFQGHPEASPGPHDIEIIFEQFMMLIKVNRKQLTGVAV